MPRLAYKEPGEIVTARVVQWDAMGETATNFTAKPRPVVMLKAERDRDRRDRPDTGRWWIMGLTTLSTYANGNPRTPNPQAVESGIDSFLWGPNAVLIDSRDIGHHIAWAGNELIDTIIEVTGWSAWELEPMRPHARRDRRRSRTRR